MCYLLRHSLSSPRPAPNPLSSPWGVKDKHVCLRIEISFLFRVPCRRRNERITWILKHASSNCGGIALSLLLSPAMWFLNIEKSGRKSHCGHPRALRLFCCSVSFEIKPDGFAQSGSLFGKQSWWQIPGRWCLWPRINNVSVLDGEKC